jgi:methionyl-tRNA formyltransferase
VARLAFLGTPELAVPPLRALVAAGHEIPLVVSRPDRRRGRGAAVSPSPVKAAAVELGLPVSDRLGDLEAAGAELGVVVAFGRLIPAALLDRLPMVNLHFSLLPRWRGAAPVERALLAGDATTGVSVMALEAGLDTGPVYASAPVDVRPDDDLASLRSRLVEVGTALLLPLVAEGRASLPEPRPQQGTPTYAEKLRPDELELAWCRPVEELGRLVRLGDAFSTFRGRRLRVRRARAEVDAGAEAPPPGTLVGLAVRAGDGWLHLEVVQPEGGRAMAADDWRRGVRPEAGEGLGPPGAP